MIDKTVIKNRHLYLGGSDTAVYGVNPFKTPYELWEEKTQLKPHEEISNANIDFGNKAEEIMSNCIKNLYEEYRYSPNSKKNGIYRANADGLDKLHVIEFKTSKTSNKSKYQKYPPITYWLQVQRYMQIFKKKKAHIWFYFATPIQLEKCDVSKISLKKMMKHEIKINNNVLAIMDEMAFDFWQYVDKKIPPLNYLIDHQKNIKKLEELYEMSILKKLGVQNLSETYRPYKSMIIYGKSGTGKTTFATKDGNALVLDVNEHGAGVATSGNVIEVKSWEHLKAVIQAIPELKKEINFDTLVIETLGKLRDIALATVMAQNGHAKAIIQDYGETAKMIKDMVEFVIEKQNNYKFHLILTGHEAINGNTDSEGATINPTVSVDVQAAIQSAITTSVDIIARAAIIKKVSENNDEIYTYIIDITPSSLYVTKARTKNNIKLEKTVLENAGVSKLVRLVETGKAEE